MKDKNGTEIKVGDILRYQETHNDTEDYGKSLDEVIIHGGEMCGVQRVGFWHTRFRKLSDIKAENALKHA